MRRISRLEGVLVAAAGIVLVDASVGTWPNRAFKRQYTEQILGEWRTLLLLGRSL